MRVWLGGRKGGGGGSGGRSSFHSTRYPSLLDGQRQNGIRGFAQTPLHMN